MNIEELLKGESNNIEYKEFRPEKSAKYLKTVVAFSNTNGGKPSFTNGEVDLVATIYRAKSENEQKMSDKLSDKDAHRLQIVLQYLEKNDSIATGIAAKLLNVEVKTANRLLTKACDLKILNSIGENKARVYVLKKGE